MLSISCYQVRSGVWFRVRLVGFSVRLHRQPQKELVGGGLAGTDGVHGEVDSVYVAACLNYASRIWMAGRLVLAANCNGAWSVHIPTRLSERQPQLLHQCVPRDANLHKEVCKSMNIYVTGSYKYAHRVDPHTGG